METIERLESQVRSYCRGWPVVFEKAKGSHLYDEEGNAYLDFFAGAGALNYGHNDPQLKQKLLEYLAEDTIVHSLDMFSSARRRFLETFEEVVLKPRGLDYVVQFPGPTGTNAVEAALKLARKVTGREHVVGFTNGFHGMTLGSLSVTANSMKRRGAGVALTNSTSMPFDGYLGDDVDTLEYFEAYIEGDGSGMDLPAAVILETMQAEGGVNAASYDWLKRLEELCRKHDILLIIDDIQVGCGRTGPFFSFEPAGLKPDMVCLSKSLSGFGLPFAVTLIRRDLDIWDPGEHNGTFRGHNPAFVTATEALNAYWRNDDLTKEVQRKARTMSEALQEIVEEHPEAQGEHRGRGLLQGIAVNVDDLAGEICKEAFARGLIIETSGPQSEVVKLLPALTISPEDLEAGLRILKESFEAAIRARGLERASALAGR